VDIDICASSKSTCTWPLLRILVSTSFQLMFFFNLGIDFSFSHFLLYQWMVCTHYTKVMVSSSHLVCATIKRLFLSFSLKEKSWGGGFSVWFQVLLPYCKSMLILGSIRSVCVTNLLRNSMLQCIFAHSSWLLHHARAALSERSAQHCSSRVPFILDSNWLQICCTSIFSKWEKK
jgi:hypothetical protein